jgi:hypothetical protein
MFPKACLPAANNRSQESSLPFFVIHHCSQMHWMEKLLYDFPSSENFLSDCSGCQQTRTTGQPLECPVVNTGNVFEVLLSQKYYPYSRRPNLWFSPWLNCKVNISSSRKKCFLRHTKKSIYPVNNHDCHYPDHDCTRSKLLVRNCAFLSCYIASIGNSLPTFQDNPSVSSFWILDPWRWDL